MAKKAPSFVIDGMLTRIADADRQVLCSDEPADFADVANVALAEFVVNSADFTIGDDGDGGRQITVAAQTGGTVDTSGTATHIVLVNTAAEALRYVTTCPPVALTANRAVDTAAWSVTVGAPE